MSANIANKAISYYLTLLYPQVKSNLLKLEKSWFLVLNKNMERFKFIKNKDFSNPVKSAPQKRGGVSPKAKQFDWASLPKTAGVYCFIPSSKLHPTPYALNPIYIGKAINIQSRVKNHFTGENWWEKALLRQGFGGRIGFIKTDSEIEALILEANLIKKYQPKFNVVWRDDKNYFYVAIARNKNKIPYIFVTHQPSFAKASEGQAQKYIGPFVEGTALKKTLRFLRHAFPYYTSAKHPKLKCTYCHLGLCPGPLLFENPPSLEASKGLREYEKNIKKLILILQGKRSTVLNSLTKEMEQLSKRPKGYPKFEEAGKVRDKIFNLQQVMSHTHIINGKTEIVRNLSYDKFLTISVWDKTQKTLKGLLNINKNVSRIECYDVSNIQGKFATGSMVVFLNGAPVKSEYKKFKIKMKNEPNDIAMLKEILERRLFHKEWPYPEVMLIDGGVAQLNVAAKTKSRESASRGIKVISIAKGKQELFIEGREKPIPLKSLPQEVYNLIKQLDDEAHRFAIAYHKKLRKKFLLQ